MKNISKVCACRRLVASSLMLMCLTGRSGAQHFNLEWFYPNVDSLIEFPTSEKNLVIKYQKRIDRKYVSFVGTKKDTNKVLLAVITPKPLKGVDTAISLFVDFDLVKPTPGKVSSWGYIFDRNHDGKIDYMAELAGAAPVWKDDVPANYPKRGKPLTRNDLEIFVSHCSLIFDHWADDNFDDSLDATIHHDMDPERDWVQRQIVVRSTRFDGNFDSVSTFRLQPGDLEDDTIAYSSGWVPFYPLGGKSPDAITRRTFLEKTEILHLLNRAAKMCGLTSRNFYPELPEE